MKVSHRIAVMTAIARREVKKFVALAEILRGSTDV
jgi:hypothetical protein